MPGVKAVLYHGNVPRIAHCTAGQGYPEPSPYDTFMFDTKVRYVGDRVAAVAAETEEQAARRRRQAIKVEYEVLTPVFSIDEAIAEGAPIIHDEPDAQHPHPRALRAQEEPRRPRQHGSGRHREGPGRGATSPSTDTYETHYASSTPIEPYVSLAHSTPGAASSSPPAPRCPSTAAASSPSACRSPCSRSA